METMYDRILVGTDGSAVAELAVEQAIGLASLADAELHAVYVVETRTGYDNAIVDPDVVRENLREEGRSALAAIEREAGDERPVTTSIREGVPADELLDYATDREVDLLVVGAVGRSTFKTVLLGSTTEALLRSSVPVLVVGDQDGTRRAALS